MPLGKVGGSLPRGGKIQVRCHYCGSMMTRFRSVVAGKKHVHCSYLCLNQTRKSGAYPQPRKRIQRACDACGDMYEILPSRLKYRGRGFSGLTCSMSCASKLKFARLYPKQTLTCDGCGLQFQKAWGMIRKYRGKRAYCSQRCYLSLKRERHHAWRGGAAYTTTDEWMAMRRLVLERDRHRCVMCHSSTKLHVHHVVPFRICKMHESSNLMTLCKSCHMRAHRKATSSAMIVLPVRL